MILNFYNKSATFLASNQICHSKLKHIALDVNFVGEQVGQGLVIVQHFPGVDQSADIFTKTLRPNPFIEQKSNLVEILS